MACCAIRRGTDDRVTLLSPAKEGNKSSWEQKNTAMTALLSQILESLAQQQATMQELKGQHLELAHLMQQRHEVLSEKVDSGISALFQRLDRWPAVTPKRTPSAEGPGVFHEISLFQFSKHRKASMVPTPEAELKPSVKHSEDGQSMCSQVRKVICSPHFDIGICAVILFNICVMMVQYQWKGLASAYDLGLREDDPQWASSEFVFDIFEYVFSGFYLVEMFVRIWAYRWAYFTLVNLMDAFLVIATSIECFVLQPLDLTQASTNFVAVRVARLARVSRVLRIIRLTTAFEEMRIIVRTCMVSFRSLLWSCLLLGGIIAAAGLTMVQLTANIVENEATGIDTRRWAHTKFGTSMGAMYTIFEATFTTGWPAVAQPLINEVHVAWALFWVPFVVIVNFAVMRIIAALFLKQTMAVAALDAERVAYEKVKEKEHFASELRHIFAAGDTSGDGMISRDEFELMLGNVEVVASFKKLELEMEEVEALFNVLSADDGQADYEEFLAGALKMKCSARTMDAVQILHAQILLSRGLKQVWDSLQRLNSSLCTPSTPETEEPSVQS